MGDSTSHTKKDAQTLEEIDSVQEDISCFEHSSLESRMRVYPRTAGATVRLTPDAAADTWGAWTQVIAAGTVLFPYHIVGVMVENQFAADTWIGQLARSATPTGAQYIGEWRIKLGAVVGIFPTNFIPIRGSHSPTGNGVWARVQSAAAAANWIDISVTLTRHLSLEKTVVSWPTWPW